MPNHRRAHLIYKRAIEYVTGAGLLQEIRWQREMEFQEFSESDLLREAAWVILCSGFREVTVRALFDYISLCFCDWESSRVIVASRSSCKDAAMRAFRHDAKLEAIVSIAEKIDSCGFRKLKAQILEDPITELQRLPYIGATTVWHIAKNLGYNTAKPDRHLARVSCKLGYPDAFAFCQAIAKMADEKTNVVDLIIWRFLADNPRLRKEWL